MADYDTLSIEEREQKLLLFKKEQLAKPDTVHYAAEIGDHAKLDEFIKVPARASPCCREYR